jgi:hypothetical protein
MDAYFHALSTVIVYVNGHELLEYYFAVRDSRVAANDFDGEHCGRR